jgi:hypothetical protein
MDLSKFKRFKIMIKHIIETTRHKLWVFYFLLKFCYKLFFRALIHDFSKYGKHEAKYFIKALPRLKYLTYGSKEYKDCLQEIKPAIDHHQKTNKHHPEYYNNLINGMSLLDIVEMFYDWKAATKRHNDGNIIKSIEINSKRFNYDKTLKDIFNNSI